MINPSRLDENIPLGPSAGNGMYFALRPPLTLIARAFWYRNARDARWTRQMRPMRVPGGARGFRCAARQRVARDRVHDHSLEAGSLEGMCVCVNGRQLGWRNVERELCPLRPGGP